MHLGKHGNLEWLPGKTHGDVRLLRHRRRARRPAARVPVPGQRPRRGHPGQAPRARHAGRPPHPADGPRRDLRRHRPARTAPRRARQHRRARPGQAARDPPADLDADAGRPHGPRPRPGRPPATRTCSTSCCCTSTAGCARSRTCRSATGCTCSAPRPTGEVRVDLVLAMLRARQMWGGDVNAARACGRRSGSSEDGAPAAERRRRGGAGPRAGGRDGGRRAGTPPRRPPWRAAARPTSSGCSTSPPREVVPAAGAAPPRSSTASLHALDGGFVPAGPSGSPLRGLINVLPTGRNFYSVDPKAVPSRLAWETGQAMAESLAGALPRRARRVPAQRGACRCGAPARCAPPATTWPRCWRCWACARCGTRPVRRVTDARGRSPRRARPPAHRRHRAHLGLLPRRVPARAGACSTTRCSSSRASTSPPTGTSCGPRRRPHGDAPRHHPDLRVEAGHLRGRASCS